MANQIEGVIVGTIAAMVLVPVVRIIWQRLAPGAYSVQLTADARRRNSALSREALIAAFGSLALWALAKGPSTELGPFDVATAIGIAFGAPYWWVLLRTTLRGRGALAEYAAYVELKDGISFRSLSVVAVVATVVAVSCGILGHVRAA